MTSTAFDVHDSSQVSAPRREASSLAARLGFSEERAGQVSLVVSELGTNLVKHAKQGQIVLRGLAGSEPEDSGLEVLAIDRGPGFSNIGEALRDGHSTSGTLGAGLGAIARQSDQFDIYTQLPGGTAIVCRWWTRAPDAQPPGEGFGVGAVSVAIHGEQVCG